MSVCPAILTPRPAPHRPRKDPRIPPSRVSSHLADTLDRAPASRMHHSPRSHPGRIRRDRWRDPKASTPGRKHVSGRQVAIAWPGNPQPLLRAARPRCPVHPALQTVWRHRSQGQTAITLRNTAKESSRTSLPTCQPEHDTTFHRFTLSINAR